MHRHMQCRIICLRKSDNVRVAFLRQFGQGSQKYLVQFTGEGRIVDAGWSRWGGTMMVKQLTCFSFKNSPARHKLVDHYCQCVLIRGWSNLDRRSQGGIIKLLWRHVERCTN